MSEMLYRPRRLRRSDALRRLVAETTLTVHDLIYPLFVTHGQSVQEEIASMPGNFRWSIDLLTGEIERIAALGIPGVLLFGLPVSKDMEGSEAYAEDGIVQQAVRAIKKTAPGLLAVTDVCLCEYTSHGHCGRTDSNGQVLNDPTLELLSRTALSHAQAGADIVAPSDMMDGRVRAIRQDLDAEGFSHIAVMAYSAKYASGFYGPFREAADSAPQFGDRKSYQMDPPNRREALREVKLDIAEGADMVMIKPALAYLDIIREARAITDLPLVAYNVSGEFSMVKAAAMNGWIDEKRVATEILLGIKRAGADIILTYHAKEMARWLIENGGHLP
ncbi:MAG: porphobilinogen synthase [Armatimonadetes bacterium]|nr:porphobilinogen synthase [Armatimonadota bacterium]